MEQKDLELAISTIKTTDDILVFNYKSTLQEVLRLGVSCATEKEIGKQLLQSCKDYEKELSEVIDTNEKFSKENGKLNKCIVKLTESNVLLMSFLQGIQKLDLANKFTDADYRLAVKHVLGLVENLPVEYQTKTSKK